MRNSIRRVFENKSLITAYTFLLFCIMPMVVTPWRAEMFQDGKLVLVAFITMAMSAIMCYKYLKSKIGFDFKRINRGRYEFVIGFFAVLAILSTIFSVNLGLSLWGQPHSREGLVSILIYLMIFYLFYRGFAFSNSLFMWILVSASLVSVYGILQYYGIARGLHEFVKGEWEQGLTTIGNRNFVGTYALLMLTVGVGLVLCIKHGQMETKSGQMGTVSKCHKKSGQMGTVSKCHKKYHKIGHRNNRKHMLHIFLMILCGLIFGLLVASMTRSAWIGFAVVFAIYFMLSLKSKDMLIKWIILLVFFAGIFGVMNTSKDSQVKERAKTIVEDAKDMKKDSAGSYRMYYWKRTRAIMFDKPWLGSGPDTYGEAFKDEYGEDKINLYFEKAHNEYLQMAVTLGYPALGLYLTLVTMVLWGLIKVMRSLRKKNGDGPCGFGPCGFTAPIVFCCIVGYLVQAFFNISVISTAPLYWAMLGIGARLGEDNKKAF